LSQKSDYIIVLSIVSGLFFILTTSCFCIYKNRQRHVKGDEKSGERKHSKSDEESSEPKYSEIFVESVDKKFPKV